MLERPRGQQFRREVMATVTPRSRAKIKMKAKRKIPRAKVTRIQGNTAGVRTRLKKAAGKARAASAKAK
jgi:translation initiation factor 1 (eIF-1/SUI1)